MGTDGPAPRDRNPRRGQLCRDGCAHPCPCVRSCSRRSDPRHRLGEIDIASLRRRQEPRRLLAEGHRRPINIDQITTPGLESDFAPISAAPTHPKNARGDTTSFLGRETETADAIGLLTALGDTLREFSTPESIAALSPDLAAAYESGRSVSMNAVVAKAMEWQPA